MSDVPDKDFIEAEVESTLTQLRPLGLSPAELEGAANVLRMALTGHPAGRYLVSRAKPRVVKESGATAVETVNGRSSHPPAKAGSSR